MACMKIPKSRGAGGWLMQIVKKMSLNGLMVDLEKKMFLKTKQFAV